MHCPGLGGYTSTKLIPKGHTFQEFGVVSLIRLIADLTSHFGLANHILFNNKTKQNKTKNTPSQLLYRCLFSSVLKTYLILLNTQSDGNLSGKNKETQWKTKLKTVVELHSKV